MGAWEGHHGPTDAGREAFSQWAMNLVENGPGDDALTTMEEDEYVALVQGAGIFVTFLAIEQDRSIFLRRIEPA